MLNLVDFSLGRHLLQEIHARMYVIFLLFVCLCAGSESYAGSQSPVALVAIPSVLAFISIVLFIIVLYVCFHSRTKRSNTAVDCPDYTPSTCTNTQSQDAANTKENAYEIGMQPMRAELKPHTQEHDTSI